MCLERCGWGSARIGLIGLPIDKNSEKWAYVLQADLYNKLSQSKVIQEAALRSGIAKGAINAAWDAIGEVIFFCSFLSCKRKGTKECTTPKAP